MKRLEVTDGHQLTLEPRAEGRPERVHVFSQTEIDAVNAALGAGRPLLVRGEPGVGKTQLAEAAAKCLGRVLLPFVVDAASESRDLLWQLDAVQRLADAQLLGAAGALSLLKKKGNDQGEDQGMEIEGLLDATREVLASKRYLHPGPLWWAFNWEDASSQATLAKLAPPAVQAPGSGCVVLIDEIDKAESDLPNGLLEALGARSFRPQGRTAPVTAKDEQPLVIITTNEERTLPDAFVRRCLVLHLRLPDEDRETLIEYLIGRGKAHFEDADRKVLQKAASMIAEDRAKADANQWLPLPGQAEYLDLVRAVLALERSAEAQLQRLGALGRFVLEKHPDAALAGDEARARADDAKAPKQTD